jgi:hypothetical protein
MKMGKQRTRRYSIEIKDDEGRPLVFTAADWTDDERRLAVAKVLRLAGVPTDSFTEPEGDS